MSTGYSRIELQRVAVATSSVPEVTPPHQVRCSTGPYSVTYSVSLKVGSKGGKPASDPFA
eukprot:784738-Rhodomonas_salina.1